MGARTLLVGLVMLAALVAVGFFTGIAHTGREVRSQQARRGPVQAPVQARSYADMRAAQFGPNAQVHPAEFLRITAAQDLFAPFERTLEDREQALARRAELRAYDGAPPRVPHAVTQLASPDCLACHAQGARIGELVAPKMSHPQMDSCVQCHVADADPRPDAPRVPPPENTFAGAFFGAGERAWAGAPPVMPHPTHLRQECGSCHGALGALGLRASHPWRQSCTQCHAPSAELEQAPVRPVGAPMGAFP